MTDLYQRLGEEWRRAVLNREGDVVLDIDDVEDILRENGQKKIIERTYRDMEEES